MKQNKLGNDKQFENAVDKYVNPLKEPISESLDSLQETLYDSSIKGDHALITLEKSIFLRSLIEHLHHENVAIVKRDKLKVLRQCRCMVKDFCQGTDFCEDVFMEEITKCVSDFELKNNLEDIDELKDCITILEMQSLKSNNIDAIKFLTSKNILSIKSNNVIAFFFQWLEFVQILISSEVNKDDLTKRIDQVKWTKKKRLHALVHDIYKVFAKHDYLDFKFNEDIFLFGIEKKGKYPGLKNQISLWIYDLLFYFHYVDHLAEDRPSEKSEDERRLFIKDCMKDTDYHSWGDMAQPSEKYVINKE